MHKSFWLEAYLPSLALAYGTPASVTSLDDIDVFFKYFSMLFDNMGSKEVIPSRIAYPKASTSHDLAVERCAIEWSSNIISDHRSIDNARLGLEEVGNVLIRDDYDSRRLEDLQDVLAECGKDAERVVGDYLTQIFELFLDALSDMREAYERSFSEGVYIVITVPSVRPNKVMKG